MRKRKNEYNISRQAFTIPKVYRDRFGQYADVVILRSCLYIYPHTGKNKGKHILKRKISVNGQIALSAEPILNIWGDYPEVVRLVEYKSGFFVIPVNAF